MSAHDPTAAVFNRFKIMTPLIKHACEGNVKEVRALLDAGTLVDEAAIMAAAMCGQHECLALFFPFSDTNWQLALKAATTSGHAQCLKLLMDNRPEQWESPVEGALAGSVHLNRGDCTQVLVEHMDHSTPHVFDWHGLFVLALEFRNTTSFFAILPYCDTSDSRLADILEGAALRGITPIVQALAPLSGQWDPPAVHKSLIQAIWKGHKDIVHILVPLVNVGYDNSVALRTALELGDEDIAELLYDGSDLPLTLKILEIQQPNLKVDRLKDRIDAQRQKIILTDAVGQTNSTRTKKI